MSQPVSSSLSTVSVQVQRAVIVSVDPVAQTAQAQTRYTTTVTIDTSFHVGAVHVVPAVGEHWYIRRISDKWVLDRKGPHGTDVLANVISNPTSGTYQVGSSGADSGPLNLLGSLVVAMAPLVLDSFPTATYPDAGSAGEGALIWDPTLSLVAVSNGTSWNPITTGGGGGGTAVSVAGEVPSGVKNGTNATFTTAHNFVSGSTAVYRNGLREHLGSGYTEPSSSTLFFTTAPLSSDDITVDYVKQ